MIISWYRIFDYKTESERRNKTHVLLLRLRVTCYWKIVRGMDDIG